MIFIKLNASILSNLYMDRARQNLREDCLLIKMIAEENHHTVYNKIFSDSKLRFTLINTDGSIIFDSKNKNHEKYMDNHSTRKEIQEALSSEDGFCIRKSKTLGKTMAYYAILIENKYGERYILRTSSDYSGQLKQIYEFLLVQIVFFLILNFIIHFFYKNYIKRDFYFKIRKMKRFLEDGTKEKINYSKSERWLFEFWDILKEWQGNNLKNIEILEREQKILSQVLLSVDFFIGLLDKNGNFIVKNNVLKYVVNPMKDKYLESIRYIEVIEIIKKSIVNNCDIREEVYIKNIKKYFIVSVKYLGFTNRHLVTIKDITSTREAVEVQKTFISNVSHELKTPLTNIKGYLIALEDAPEDMKKMFLDIINNNVIKLENLVLDFLNISKIESSNIVNISQIEVEKIKKDIFEIFDRLIQEKNVEIKFEFNLTDGRNYMKIDYDKTLTIIKNLVENAIVYNDKKNPKIQVKIYEKGDRYKIIIEDNGMGIPLEEQNKIFERFYRVDKARTSNLGGTGLGLTIVKTLVEKCGGSINIESVEKEGTIFTFYLMK